MPRIFIAVILFAATLLLSVFYLRPEWDRFQTLRTDVAELEQISSEFDELIANRDKLLSLINSISKENLGRVDRMLPQGPHASDFLVSMEALTIQNSVALRRIDLVSPEGDKSDAQPQRTGAGQGTPRPAGAVSSPRPVKEVQSLPFNLQVAGSYASFKKFLADMERNLRLIDVENISFSASGKGEISDFTLKAKTYYQ
ncbi:MAG: hypothetical protein A3J10_03630 [Candidatus Sungbacteria bacterium RIFCSPLOWO2_02_FULL_54_10]|uniref:Pilus assembly protein PilO n=2 Tax=Candidatus Sungiibacteriota TaxID=1817917 RepID=A0A1G2L4U5_9BACT|nr:MAG: hypothetical protein A2679_02110 [Candidatus Sungbacteria bacterium RIFCSPHIGHO2_01_FULL_54_26]OHA02682.1 MAG: hypothetical protein A3C92_02570 [Candidatus Sungbacteria bacterium RIFCSPHIGHO2_02_FULL_53_17]OHA06534.1 MAG: hypothetical protein A3B34_01305 [Candidatus Sungbacteria bacterium RIFCSPLOWO2_01_FULL_54_21]OHA11912.1 MAG: hypothetical protein A3J10_03630 [Candidatus Sungbacteria bacterium RIFCSPLOWO2_02_FULL_54_10]